MIQKTAFTLSCLFSLNYLAAQNPKALSQPIVNPVPNPSARYQAQNGVGLYTSIEALLFQVTQDDFPMACIAPVKYDGFYPPKPVPDTPNKTWINHLFHYRQNWRWGFRLAAGYHLPHDDWDLDANYVRYYTTSYKVIGRQNNENFLVAAPQGNIFDNVLADDNPYPYGDELVTFQWDFKFNQWDLDFSRTFFVSKYLRIQPLLGLRNLMLGQRFYTEAVVRIEDSSRTETLTSLNKVHFWGMGVLAGLNTYWNLNYQFTIYGKCSVASLFGHYNPTITDNMYERQYVIQNLNDEQKISKSCLDLAIGAQWDKNFYNNKFHLGLNAGFEQHSYFNMNKGFFGALGAANYDGTSGRDLTLQGFSFGLRVDY